MSAGRTSHLTKQTKSSWVSDKASATTGAIIGLHLGFAFGSVKTAAKFTSDMIHLIPKCKSSHSAEDNHPHPRSELLLELGAAPIIFFLGPVHGAYKGAKIGAYIGPLQTFVEIPRYCIDINPDTTILERFYAFEMRKESESRNDYIDRKQVRDEKKKAKLAKNSMFTNAQDQENDSEEEIARPSPW